MSTKTAEISVEKRSTKHSVSQQTEVTGDVSKCFAETPWSGLIMLT